MINRQIIWLPIMMSWVKIWTHIWKWNLKNYSLIRCQNQVWNNKLYDNTSWSYAKQPQQNDLCDSPSTSVYAFTWWGDHNAVGHNDIVNHVIINVSANRKSLMTGRLFRLWWITFLTVNSIVWKWKVSFEKKPFSHLVCWNRYPVKIQFLVQTLT